MARLVNFFDGAASGTVPTIGNIVASNLVQYANDAAFVAGEQGAPTTGNIYYNTTDDVIRYYNGTVWQSILDETTVQTVENKTIDGTAATGNNTVTTDASDIEYDNSSSGLTATQMQAATDEIEGRVDTVETDLNTAEGDIDDLETLSGSPGATDHGTFTGSTISDNNTTKGSLQELETAVDNIGNPMNFLGAFDPTGPTPNLTNGTGDLGDFYRVSVAGSHDFGAGSIAFKIGDSVVYDGSIWQKYDEQTLNDTDALPEGATNLYYTDGRADARIAAASIDDLSDVDTTTSTPNVDDALVWDGSDWVPGVVSGDGGSGGINYIDNDGAEVDLTGWNTYVDAASDIPVDGTGGSPSSTLARSLVNPARDTAMFVFSKGASNLQGEGVSYDFSIDNADRGRELDISFEYLTNGTFITDDMRVYIYDVTNASIITPSIKNNEDPSIEHSSTAWAKFNASFWADDTSTSYRLIFHVATTTTVARSLSFDDVRVGPKSFFNVPIISEWQDYTPITQGFGTLVSEEFEWRRVGDTVEIRGRFNTGTVAAIEAQCSLPLGLTSADTTKIPSIKLVGYGTYIGNADLAPAMLIEPNVTYFTFGIQGASNGGLNKLNGSQIVSSGTDFSLFASCPVAGWDAGALLSTSQANDQTIAVQAKRETSTQNINDSTTTTVIFNGEDIDSHNAFNISNGYFTAPRKGNYFIAASIGFTAAALTVGEDFFLYLTKDPGGTPANQRLLDFKEQSANNTEGINIHGSTMIDLNKDDVISIRVLQRTGLTLTIENADNVSFLSIYSLPDFTTFGVYGKKELIEASGTLANYTITAGQYGDLTSIILPSGDWDIIAQAFYFSNGATTTTNIRIGISTTSGNSSAGLVLGNNLMRGTKTQPSNGGDSLTIGRENVLPTNTTTYYLKASVDTSITNLQVAYKISARRVG